MLNLWETYNLIKMKADEKWKTAFRIRYGHYKYKVMLFDLINASVTCQQMINDILRDLLNVTVIAYLDDILIFFKNLTKHEEHVRQVLKCLMKYKLHLKSEKCEWFKKEVKFLEFMIENNLIQINLTKLTAVKEWRQLMNVKEIQFFLRFVNYNQKFIKHFFQIRASLHNLT